MGAENKNGLIKFISIAVFLLIFSLSPAYAIGEGNPIAVTLEGTNTPTVTIVTNWTQYTTYPDDSDYVRFYISFNVTVDSDDNITYIAFEMPDAECVNNTLYNVTVYNNTLTIDNTKYHINQTASLDSDSDGLYEINASFGSNKVLATSTGAYNFTIAFYCEPLANDESISTSETVFDTYYKTTSTVTVYGLTNLTYQNVTISYSPSQFSTRTSLESVKWNDTAQTNYTTTSSSISVKNLLVGKGTTNTLEIIYHRDRPYSASTKSDGTKTTSTPTFRPLTTTRIDVFSFIANIPMYFIRGLGLIFNFRF